MNYEELRGSIEKWAENHESDFLAEVDTFIRYTENAIVTSVRMPQFSKVASVSLTQYSPTSQAPADLLAIDSIVIPGNRPILKKDPEFIYEASGQDYMGCPRFFAMLDDLTILFGPTPDQQFAANIRYYNQPISLCDQQEGTYISNNYPAALLSGCLWRAAIFMKDWEAVQLHNQDFMNALGVSKRFIEGQVTKQTYEKVSSAVSSGEQV